MAGGEPVSALPQWGISVRICWSSTYKEDTVNTSLPAATSEVGDAVLDHVNQLTLAKS